MPRWLSLARVRGSHACTRRRRRPMFSLQKPFSTLGNSRRIMKSAGVVLAAASVVFVAVTALCPVAAADTDFCTGGILDAGAPLGTTGPDLVITNMTCTVDGTKAPYNFHNV